MAHPASVKGAALARLLTGETPGMVARGMGLSRRTLRRWQEEARALGENGPDLANASGYTDWSLLWPTNRRDNRRKARQRSQCLGQRPDRYVYP